MANLLLSTLADNIRDCSAVGLHRPANAAACCRRTPPPSASQRLVPLPAGITQASWANGNHFIARHSKRRLYIYIANDDYPPDKPDPAGPDALQDAFVAYLIEQGGLYTQFSNVDQLGRAVLKETMAPQPVVAKGRPASRSCCPIKASAACSKGATRFKRPRASLTRRTAGRRRS
jgi:hypothetical protein